MAASIALNGPVFRTDSSLSNSDLPLLPFSYPNHLEKRQLFLRSYQFSRKETFADRIKSSLRRFRRLLRFRLRSALRLRRLVWSRLRSALRRRFARLVKLYRAGIGRRCSDSCFR